MDEHWRHMKRALRLARRGQGRVSPNPMVGAVIVKEGRVVGEGWHVFEKKDHAEVAALRRAGGFARGADLYVSLEPCSHYGRTPPCVDALISAGLQRVFVAVRDPNPLVCGRGISRLLERGIEVHEGLCGEEAARLNEKFFHFVRTRRPFVLLKLALSLDGRIATSAGESRWITGESARRFTHRLRFEYDALLVGVNTVLLDDPSLDARGPGRKLLNRIVLDSELRTPPDARLFNVSDPVLIFHDANVSEERMRALEQKGATLVRVRRDESGLKWNAILDELGGRGVTSVLVEGGGRVAASALRSGIVRKINFFYAPKILGGDGIAGVGPLSIADLTEALRVTDLRIRRLDPDVLLEGYLDAM